MEDRTIKNNGIAHSSDRQEYAESLFHALVACYVNDLKHGLKNFMSGNHAKNLGWFKALLEEIGHSIAEAHQLAIVKRRQLRKERTRARNEKIKTDRIAAREERRRMKAEHEQKGGWATEPIPDGMFIQFYPKPHESVPMYKGISVNFPDGTSLTLQECTADGLSSLIDVYHKRKEETAVCSL